MNKWWPCSQSLVQLLPLSCVRKLWQTHLVNLSFHSAGLAGSCSRSCISSRRSSHSTTNNSGGFNSSTSSSSCTCSNATGSSGNSSSSGSIGRACSTCSSSSLMLAVEVYSCTACAARPHKRHRKKGFFECQWCNSSISLNNKSNYNIFVMNYMTWPIDSNKKLNTDHIVHEV